MAAHALDARCSSCKGTGRRPLPLALREVAEVLDREWRPTGVIRAGLVGSRLGHSLRGVISLNATANRLERLRELGLVESRRVSKAAREVEWRLVGEQA